MARFRRKHPDASGTHRIMMKERGTTVDQIVIEGRDIYETDDKREIEILMADEMVEEVNKKTKIEINEK
jgi:hypothetical protein